MTGNAHLRSALDEATQLKSVPAYLAAIERLRGMFGHSIAVLEHDYSVQPQPSCYAYALGLSEMPQYTALVADFAVKTQTQPLSTAVVTELLWRKNLRLRKAAAKPGDIVLYFQGDVVRHAGILIAGDQRVRSKWGPGEVHEHGLWEVPLSYGDRTEVCVAPSRNRILKLLVSGTLHAE